ESPNIVTDSAYVAGLVMRLENSYLKETTNPQLFALLLRLKWLLDHRSNPYFIQHIRSRSSLPGPISQDNAEANRLAGALVLPNLFAQARLSHEFFQQNAKALQQSFQLTADQAKQIIQSCPDCQHILPALLIGVHP
ncbi:POK18 protein, partial [Burhinus bistriatus]|nr:POK18 protein [Burhinus bistriatus]